MAADTTILLTRHAETDWNREQRWQGVADRPLNERGREQARELADALAAVPLRAIYCSDLRRAHETAAIIAEGRGLPITALQELREIDVGSWTGLVRDEVERRFPEEYAAMRARTGRGWEGGESYADLCARALAAVRRIAREHPGETVLLVTHSGPIRAVRAHAAGADFATDREAAPAVVRLQLSAVVVGDGVFRPAEDEISQQLGGGGRQAAR